MNAKDSLKKSMVSNFPPEIEKRSYSHPRDTDILPISCISINLKTTVNIRYKRRWFTSFVVVFLNTLSRNAILGLVYKTREI